MTQATLTSFFGWALVVNLVLYTVTAFAVMVCRNFVARTGARLFGIDEQTALAESYAYVARFKLLIIVFFLAPWAALKLMG